MDASEFALRLADELESGRPSYGAWIDVRDVHAGRRDWDSQLDDAIKFCTTLLFVITEDSVRDESGCKWEWSAALQYKKPVVPVRLPASSDLPFRLRSRQFIDFTDGFDAGIERLRQHLAWTDSPEGALDELRARYADAEHDLPRAGPSQRARIEEDLEELRGRIEEQERIVHAPQSAAEQADARIGAGLELERQPASHVADQARARFVNPPPMSAPSYFQDRHVETELIGSFLQDHAVRMVSVVGRGGIGKTALVCRLLKALEEGRLPDDLGELTVAGIVYLSPAGAHAVNFPNVFGDLCRLLPAETAKPLLARYREPRATPAASMAALLEAFPENETVVVLLDNFDDLLDSESLELTDAELDEALRMLLGAPAHGVKVMLTTRVAPRSLLLAHPAGQKRLDLDEGLPSPFAEHVLRGNDPDGRLGVRDASDELLGQARERTRGLPRALEALVAILAADRAATLADVLASAAPTPETVVEAMVGEAFSRVDPLAQQVMQALAIYAFPMPSVAVDYLLQPFRPAIDSAPILNRLVNMSFARRDGDRYYLHPVDRDYALRRLPREDTSDGSDDSPIFVYRSLCSRGADYFREIRTPPGTWHGLSDLSPQLAEFELRCQADEYDAAAEILFDIGFDFLMLWGHSALVVELYSRVQGHLTDPEVDFVSKASLADACNRNGDPLRAIELYEQALPFVQAPAEHHNRLHRRRASDDEDDLEREGREAAILSNLGLCYGALGDVHRAIDLYERAVRMHQHAGARLNEATSLNCLGSAYTTLGDFGRGIEFFERSLAVVRGGDVSRSGREDAGRDVEASGLHGLGDCHTALGDPSRAFEFHQRALEIASDIGARDDEASYAMRLGHCHADLEDWELAVTYYQRAIQIADEIPHADLSANARSSLAQIELHAGSLDAARANLPDVNNVTDPFTASDLWLTRGIVLARAEERGAARQAFTDALRFAGTLVDQADDNYHALDVQGLALCGLAVMGEPDRVDSAAASFRAARAITSAPGVVRRVLRLFDAVAPVDTEGILAPLSGVASGQDPEAPIGRNIRRVFDLAGRVRRALS